MASRKRKYDDDWGAEPPRPGRKDRSRGHRSARREKQAAQWHALEDADLGRGRPHRPKRPMAPLYVRDDEDPLANEDD